MLTQILLPSVPALKKSRNCYVLLKLSQRYPTYLRLITVSACCFMLIVAQLIGNVNAAIGNIAQSAITDTTVDLTWTVSPPVGTSYFIVNGGPRGPALASPTQGTAVGLNGCASNTVTITNDGAGGGSGNTIVYTRPYRITLLTATAPPLTYGGVLVTWTLPSTPPSVACSYTFLVTLNPTGSMVSSFSLNVAGTVGSGTFQNIPAGTYDVYVYAVVASVSSPASNSLSVTVAPYTSTLPTTTLGTTTTTPFFPFATLTPGPKPAPLPSKAPPLKAEINTRLTTLLLTALLMGLIFYKP